MIEKQSRLKLKALKTNRSEEFNLKEFWNFCKSNGLRRELTMNYAFQQSGVVKRKNKMVEKVRCMLTHKNLPYKF